jgi:diguanylate cyclase (GGDEF)-like protein
MSVIAHGLLTNKLITLQSENLERTANTNRIGIMAMLNTQITEVSLLAIQTEIQELIKLNNPSDAFASSGINQLLETRKNEYPTCESITVFNSKKQVIASSDPLVIGQENQSDYALSYMLVTREISIAAGGLKPITKSGKTFYTIDVGCPIFDSDSNSLIGYVVSSLNASFLDELLESINFGKSGLGILLDYNGTVIYHPEPNLITKNINSTKLSGLVNDYNRGNIKSSGSFEYFFDNTNQAFGYSIIPKLNFVLLVKQDISEIRSLTTIMLYLLIFISAVILIIIIIFANWLAKYLSAPIISLRDAMRTASDGNLNIQSNIKSNNELGELSKSFNKMLHIIKTNYEDLEAMHEELLSNEEQLRMNYDHIEFLAYHDILTNLPNKLAFLDYMNGALLSSPSDKKIHAVYFVDLDNFKTVNDTLGHEYGDTLLVKTAQILTNVIGGDGMLARAGGDEFLIFKENMTSKKSAVDFAHQMIESFHNPLDLEGEMIYVSMSIGIAVYPENGLSPNTLIKNADIAMYKSKDTGKNKYTMFDSKMEDELNRNTIIIEVLRNAIDNHEIYIQYQPLIELTSNKVIGFEALMRIRSERLGFLTPKEFIPIAEESGLIIELSSWLIREACSFNKKLIDQGNKPRPVSVNISSVQINRPGFTNLISEILSETGLPPECLELEITESTLVSSIMDATQLLTSLQKIGVKVSLDDFGTGYSSLNYLTKMPINTLKIDKSFIDNICHSKKDAFIAESIIKLAHSLDIKVVAEGVEHENQLSMLRAHNCDIIQGYIFSAPLHPEDLTDIIYEL